MNNQILETKIGNENKELGKEKVETGNKKELGKEEVVVAGNESQEEERQDSPELDNPGMAKAMLKTNEVPQSTPPRKAIYLDQKCELTERDIGIFAFLNKYTAAALGQLWTIFFKEISQETEPLLFLDKRADGKGVFNSAYQRLLKLAAAGYLDRRIVNGQIMFKLAPKAQWQLSKRSQTQFTKPPAWPQDAETDHALILTACGAIFEKVLGLEVTAQRQIHNEYAKLPDWRREDEDKEYLPDFFIRHEGHRLRFEFERTLKSDRRYKDYWSALGAPMCSPRPHLLYLTVTDEIKNRLLRIAKDDYYPGLYACDLDSFKTSFGRSVFVSFNRDFALGGAYG